MDGRSSRLLARLLRHSLDLAGAEGLAIGLVERDQVTLHRELHGLLRPDGGVRSPRRAQEQLVVRRQRGPAGDLFHLCPALHLGIRVKLAEEPVRPPLADEPLAEAIEGDRAHGGADGARICR
jgi:hypothetical protein